VAESTGHIVRWRRRGEVLGLRWRDVDLDAGRVATTQALTAPNYELHFSAPKMVMRSYRLYLEDEEDMEMEVVRELAIEHLQTWAGREALVDVIEQALRTHEEALSDYKSRRLHADLVLSGAGLAAA
jgi:integrase